MIGGQEIDLRSLILYTPLPELWRYFTLATAISPLDAQGFLTLSMLDSVMAGIDLKVTHTEFWLSMTTFLQRKNHKVFLDRQRKQRMKGK